MSFLRIFAGSFLISLMVLGGPVVALQSVEAVTENSVAIDQLVLSRCGQQYAYASGSATYGPKADYLMVDIDGVHAFNLGQKDFWTTDLVELNPGRHTVTARIHNTDLTFTDTTSHFTVPECQQSGGGASDGGKGKEGDCCPGPDPFEVPTKKAPQVKGVKRGVALSALSPLNSIFRLVFGRAPIVGEWKYWADRFLTDKPTWEAILGAMQWQKQQGRTVGL
jgi:hypothetical protein